MRQHLFPIREVHIPHGVLFVYRKVIYFIALIQQGLSYKTKKHRLYSERRCADYKWMFYLLKAMKF